MRSTTPQRLEQCRAARTGSILIGIDGGGKDDMFNVFAVGCDRVPTPDWMQEPMRIFERLDAARIRAALFTPVPI